MVRPDHVAGAVRAARLAASCGGPRLLAVDPSRGAVTTSGLPGVDIGAALRARPDDAEAPGRAVAGAVRRLHAPGRVRDGLTAHGPQQEVSVAVDLANLVVHLQWRALQGTVPHRPRPPVRAPSWPPTAPTARQRAT